MPKRMLDDSLLTSPSIARCSPRAQDAFPRFILLADDFGCFEVFPRVLLAKGWPHRTDVTEADVSNWLTEYAAAGMARVWAEGERQYCHLTGWDGPHGQRKRVEYDPTTELGRRGSKRRTPRPPAAGFPVVSRPGSTDFPPGNANGEIPNNSVPAREVQVSRGFPAPAVPVAVPVPVAVGTPDGVPAPRDGATRKRRAPRPPDPALEDLRADLEADYFEATGDRLDWRGSDYGDLQGIRNSLSDDAEVKRRWALFRADKFWPVKSIHKFRDAFPKYRKPQASVDRPSAIPVVRG